MNFFRNREMKQAVIETVCLTAAAAGLAFFWNTAFGLYVLLVCAAFAALHWFRTYRRYQKIRDLSDEIDRILHGQETELSLPLYEEGELAILENEIQKMTIRLREQQQKLLEDKVYLADSIADISHQIRTPLTSIHLVLQRMQDHSLSEERFSASIQELHTMLSRMDWLLDALLKISRLDTGTVPFRTETIPLPVLLQKAAEPLQVPIELREQALQIEADGNFTGDMNWTAEAIGNILKNCMEHTPAGGTLRLSAAENALYTEIRIEDTGTGIDPKDLPHIFERFYKGKQADSRSFGIGLALSRMIVARQNGTLKAENKIGGGAMFTMRFYKGTV